MQIKIIPCLNDNYAYLLKAGDDCAVLDPSEAEPVRAALAQTGWRLTHILNTHHHWDHIGGNLALKQEFGALVVGAGKDAARIPGIDVGVDERTGWRFAGKPVQILEVPGHTLGAIAFVMDGHAFTGDTLFVMGCGRLFEGDAAMMWASLCKLARLDDATKIYCGHEYAKDNVRFAATLELGNQALMARAGEINAARAKGDSCVPSTMALEKATNPFLRPASAEIRENLGLVGASDEAVFAQIRRRKDAF